MWSTFISRKLIIPSKNLICTNHLEEDSLSEESQHFFDNLRIQHESTMTPVEIEQLLNSIVHASQLSQGVLDFHPAKEVCNEHHEIFLGLHKENYLHLHGVIKDSLYNSRRRTTFNALAIFLMKLRLNLTNGVLASIFICHIFWVKVEPSIQHRKLMSLEW
jgi:hypothetical protein